IDILQRHKNNLIIRLTPIINSDDIRMVQITDNHHLSMKTPPRSVIDIANTQRQRLDRYLHTRLLIDRTKYLAVRARPDRIADTITFMQQFTRHYTEFTAGI